MAKKTKELEPIDEKKVKKATSTKKNTAKVTKKTTEKKVASTSKKATTKTSKKAKSSNKNEKKSKTTKTATSKENKAIKSTTSKSSKVEKLTASASNKTEKKVASKSSTLKKNNTNLKKEAHKVDFKSEYYDLPFMYNKTIVKVLAQTPKMLFIYWEISNEDRSRLVNSYGDNFFNSTKPVLIVYNDSLNYSFEVDIDDFANSWYLHIDDANCEYHVELGRKPISRVQQYSQPVYIPYYIYITSSNEMISPNNKILFDFNKTIRFKNIKTGQSIDKDINQFKFKTNYGIFSIQDLYKFLYPNENFEVENIELTGSSSKSGMFSSQFK